MTKGNSTTNALLAILLVLIVGFGVWYVMDKRAAEKAVDEPVIELNLGEASEE